MTICKEGFTVKACTFDENGHIIAVKILPGSVAICPVYNVDIDSEVHFYTREEAIESTWERLNKITNEEEEENE